MELKHLLSDLDMFIDYDGYAFLQCPGVRITCDKYYVDREKIYLFNFGHKIAAINIDYFKDHSDDYFVY